MTLNEIYQLYIPTKELTLAHKTVQTYKSLYVKHIADTLGTQDIRTLRYIDYQKFADKLLLSGLKPKTVQNILKFISSLYTFAQKNEWYSGENYPRMVELPKFDNKFYVTFSPEIQKKYLLAIKNFDEPLYRPIFLMLLHGRRLGEVLDLKWEFLDLSQKIVYYPASRNKAKKHLAYELTDELVDELLNLMGDAIDRQGTVFVTGHVFINPNTGKRYSDISKAWKRLLKKANLSYTKIHNIRHILGTYLINELGISLEYVSYLLGHSDTSITKRYVNFKPQIARETMNSLFKAIDPKDDNYVKKLSQAIELGECVQSVLFPDQESDQNVEPMRMHKTPNDEGKYFY